jgi:uncharacterized membrane protein
MKRIGEVLDALVAEGLVTESEANLKNQPEMDNPPAWYIQVVTAFGGWLAALFFFCFVAWFLLITLSMSNNLAIGITMSILGAFCILGSTAHIASQSSPNLFLEQFRLVFHIVGHLSLLFGISTGLELWRFDHTATLHSVLILVLLGTFVVFYPDGIFRFLAGIGIVAALNVIVYDFTIAGSLSLLIGVLGLVLLIIFAGFLNSRQELANFELLQSLPYGLVFGFFGSILLEQYYGLNRQWMDTNALYQPALTSVLLLILLLWMLIRLMQSYAIKLSSPNALFILGLVVLIALPTLNTPGILAGILVVVMAFRRRNWLLLGLAYAFLAYFIIYFYYNLSQPLNIKSYILMGTGLALLIARLLLHRILPDLEKTELSQ